MVSPRRSSSAPGNRNPSVVTISVAIGVEHGGETLTRGGLAHTHRARDAHHHDIAGGGAHQLAHGVCERFVSGRVHRRIVERAGIRALIPQWGCRWGRIRRMQTVSRRSSARPNIDEPPPTERGFRRRAREHPAAIHPRPRRPAGDRGHRGPALPRRYQLDAGRVPRRRRVLRDQRLPHHDAAARRAPQPRRRSASGSSICAGPADCSRHCSWCWPRSRCSPSSSCPTRSARCAPTSSPRSATSRTGGRSSSTSPTSPRRADRRCSATCGRSRSRSSSTSCGR